MGNLSSCDDESPIEQRCVGGLRRERSSPTLGARHHRVLDELVLSERQYVADMEMLIDVFYLPLKRWAEEQSSKAERQTVDISLSDIDKVFSNIEELIVFSRRLLPALERARAARSKAMLVVLLQLATSFKVYDVFVANCVGALEHLARMESSSPAAMFIKACELQERCRGLTVRDYLLMPLEHVAHYRLLVESTAENCPPHLVELHNELARSLSIPPQVANQILRHRKDVNCTMPGTSETVDGPSLQVPSAAAPATRPRIIKQGCLTKICEDGPKPFFFVTYGDELTYRPARTASEDHTGEQQSNERDHASIPLSHCFLIDGFDTPLEASFILASVIDSFLVQAKDVIEKDDWVAALQKAMREAANDISCSPRSSSTSSGSRGDEGDSNVDAACPGAAYMTSASDGPREGMTHAGRADHPARQTSIAPNRAGSSREGTCDQGAGLPPRPGRDGRRGRKGKSTGTTRRKKRTVFSKTYRAAMGLPVAEDAKAMGVHERAKALPLEECSVWLAHGDKHKMERVTLRLAGVAEDDAAWRGEVGFRRALDDPECYTSFRELLRERHASENLDFKEAVEHFRSSFSPGLSGADDDAEPVGPFLSPRPDKEDDVFPVSSQAIVARKIVRRFVQQEAPEQVNLSSKARETILRRQAGRPPACPPPADLFDEALAEVSIVLQRDPFVQFRNCAAFLRLKQRWAEKLNGVLSASEVILESDGMVWASEGLAKIVIPDTPIWPPRPSESLWTPSSSATTSTEGSRKSAFSLFAATGGAARRPTSIGIGRSKSSQRMPPPPPPATPATPWTGARFSARGAVVAAASPATMAITAARSVVCTASSCLQSDHLEAKCFEGSPYSLRLDVSETATVRAQAKPVKSPREANQNPGGLSPRNALPEQTEATSLHPGNYPVSVAAGHANGALQRSGSTRVDRRQRNATSATSPRPSGLRAVKLSPVVVKSAGSRHAVAKSAPRGAKVKRDIARPTDFGAFFPSSLPSTPEDTSSSASSLSDDKPVVKEPPSTPPLALPRLLVPGEPFVDPGLDGVRTMSSPSDPRRVPLDVGGLYRIKYDVKLFPSPGKYVNDTERSEMEKMAPRSGCGDEMIDREVHAESKDRTAKGSGGVTVAGAASHAATLVLASPANHRIVLRASPGKCLGVHLANEDGMAIVYAFKEMRSGAPNPAENAGLRLGDVLVSVNGLQVLGNFHRAIELMKRGQRNGHLALVVTRPESSAQYKEL